MFLFQLSVTVSSAFLRIWQCCSTYLMISLCIIYDGAKFSSCELRFQLEVSTDEDLSHLKLSLNLAPS